MAWLANEDNVKETEFEEARRCLLNLYHSYVQNHAGYVIAFIIGFFATIPSFVASIKYPPELNFWILLIVLSLTIVAFAKMFRRLNYWICYANNALNLPFDKAIDYFNKFNQERFNEYEEIKKKENHQSNKKEQEASEKRFYKTKAPNTAILQFAIGYKLSEEKKDP